MRAIDGDELLKYFQEWKNEAERQGAALGEAYALMAMEIVEMMSTIEQPEIIRCRDCKYAVRGECELFLKCNEDPVYVKDDDFCSKAERREE